MIDTRSPALRRHIMQSVRTKHTGPELTVRRMLFALGYRYRLHYGKLPGSPDLAFVRAKKAIFVHGCFWHGHDCSKGHLPKSRAEHWGPKTRANQERDARNILELNNKGWAVHVIWQCELRDQRLVRERAVRFLNREQ